MRWLNRETIGGRMDRLSELLADILPKSAEDAVGAAKLIERLRAKGLRQDEWMDSSLKSRFSNLAGQETSVIARRDGRHGYYLRPNAVEAVTVPVSGTAVPPNEAAAVAGRDAQKEEKFRAIYMAWCEQENEFPVLVDHTQALRQQRGINKWKFPDVVAVRWEVLEFNERQEPRLNKDALAVRQSLGEQSFRLSSTELKVKIDSGNLRESFFQCVSNSRWAHSARLAIACNISDEAIANEVRRLGSSYGVSVIAFSLQSEDFDKLPDAAQIKTIDQVESLLDRSLVKSTLVLANDKEDLDWEHIKDMKQQHKVYDELFPWISKCMSDCKPHSFVVWKGLLR